MRPGIGHLNRVMALIERNTGRSHALVVKFGNQDEIGRVLAENVSRDAHLMTDEWTTYKALGWNSPP